MLHVIPDLLLALVCWLLFIPIAYSLVTPVILIVALCRRSGTFLGNVNDGYRKLWGMWKTWGILLVPPW
jgi:hypothetical protein